MRFSFLKKIQNSLGQLFPTENIGGENGGENGVAVLQTNNSKNSAACSLKTPPPTKKHQVELHHLVPEQGASTILFCFIWEEILARLLAKSLPMQTKPRSPKEQISDQRIPAEAV